MKRTTILAEESLLLEAKHLAEKEGKTFTAVVQEALSEYIRARRRPGRLSIVGIGHSGQTDVSERVEEILRAEIDPVEGWSLAIGPLVRVYKIPKPSRMPWEPPKRRVKRMPAPPVRKPEREAVPRAPGPDAPVEGGA